MLSLVVKTEHDLSKDKLDEHVLNVSKKNITLTTFGDVLLRCVAFFAVCRRDE